jgi:hypothetical protein
MSKIIVSISGLTPNKKYTFEYVCSVNPGYELQREVTEKTDSFGNIEFSAPEHSTRFSVEFTDERIIELEKTNETFF